MNEIQKVDNVSVSINKPSLIDMAIKERKLINSRSRKIFLLDVSGSMDDIVDNIPKINHLHKVMKNYPNSHKISFSNDIWENYIPEIGQTGTNMVNAFKYLQRIEPKPTSIILISDGEPQDPEESIRQAINLHIPVDIIFIGIRESKGERFMKRLSKATKGSTFTIEINKPDFNKKLNIQISTTISGYLTSGK